MCPSSGLYYYLKTVVCKNKVSISSLSQKF